MQAIRVRQRLESETLTLPQLRPFIGREVEIVVSEVSPEQETTTVDEIFAGRVHLVGR